MLPARGREKTLKFPLACLHSAKMLKSFMSAFTHLPARRCCLSHSIISISTARVFVLREQFYFHFIPFGREESSLRSLLSSCKEPAQRYGDISTGCLDTLRREVREHNFYVRLTAMAESSTIFFSYFYIIF